MAVMFNFWSQVYIRFDLFCVYVCAYIYFNYTLLLRSNIRTDHFGFGLLCYRLPEKLPTLRIVDTSPVFFAHNVVVS